MKDNKVFILIPPARFMRQARCQAPMDKVMVESIRFPLTPAYITAIFKQAGYQCRFYDYSAEGRSWGQLEDDIKDYAPDILVAGITKFSAKSDLDVFLSAKAVCPGVKTIAFGGDLDLPDEIMAKAGSVDIYIKAEAEPVCKMIAQGKPLSAIPGIIYRSDQEVRYNKGEHFADLDELPFPERALMNNRLYLRPDNNRMQTEIEVGRGCPYPCIFCLAPVVNGKKVRLRKIEKVIEEIKQCVDRFAIKDFFFRADVFTFDRNWVLELCQAIKQNGLKINWCCNSRVDSVDEALLREMKSSGCWLISFGIESGVESILEKIKKGISLNDCRKAVTLCRKLGIKSYVNFMIGFPWDDKKTIQQSLRFAKRLDADFAEFPMVMPFYGTKLYELLSEYGIIAKDSENSLPLRTKYLGPEQVMRLWRDSVRSYYLRPGFIIRTLYCAHRDGNLKSYFKAGINKMLKISSLKAG